MKKIAIGVLGLLLSAPAHALGVGTTASVGPYDLSGFFAGGFGGPIVLTTASGFYPTLDLHPGTATVQIHALETVSMLTDEQLYLGANVYFNVAQVANTGSVVGVVEPGFGIDLTVIDNFGLAATFESRFGVMVPGEATFAAYIVPALGIAIDDNDTDIVIGSTVQFSVWFGS